MKKLCITLCLVFPLIALATCPAKAQAFEIQQLILNIQKLNQLKSILQEMYKGYQVLSTGYNTIKNLSEGNFSLHQVFLDGLLEVSPTVKKYKKVADIVNLQLEIVRQYKSALSKFTAGQVFSPGELEYIENVYTGLADRSLKNLDELLMVITANQLRMNDAERLNAIDRIYDEMKDKQDFLRHFNKKTTLLGAQRKKEITEYQMLEQLINPK
jgi:excinuclease UvrABC helicase subunit UvrB